MQGVLERTRPPGIPVGSFVFLPSLFASAGYNTNITASGTNEKADTLFIVRPAA